MSPSSCDTGHSCDSRSRVRHISTRSYPSGYPCRLASSPKLWRRPLCGVRPQLPRRLAHTCAVSRAIVRILRTGAQALRPVGSSGQLGKEQTRANAEDLFSQYGVGFGQPDSTPHPGTCSVGAELPQYFFRQDSVPTETFTEVPGAYGCSCGDSPAWSENQSVSGMTTICLMQCNTSPSHRVDQVVDCGLWDVGPLLFNGCAKLLDIGRNWNMLSYTSIQSIPNMLIG